MGWYGLEDLEPEQDALARARAVQRMGAKMLRMYAADRWHPEKTAAHSKLGAQSVVVADELEGLDDELAAAFSPEQRRALRRMAKRLRAYARRTAHQHDHGPGTQLGRLRLKHKHRGNHPVRKRRLTAVPISGWEADSEEDDELGFLPALMPIISSVAGPLLGGLFGGGDKKPAPAPAPAPAAPQGPPIIIPPSGGGGGPPSNVNLPAIGGVVADQIRAVPPPIRQQVTDAIRESMDRYKSGQQDAAALMQDIKTQLGPTIKAQLQSVSNAALQRQATYEHESLKRRDQRWKNNAEAQTRILQRLDAMETKLGNAVVSKAKRANAVARAFGVPPRYQE